MNTRQQGFTLMELMVVLSIAGVVLAIGAPNFNQFRLNNRLTSAGNEFLAAVTTARTEAIKRQAPVAVCPSDNPGADDAECTAGEFRGWIVFADTNNDCERDSAAVAPDDEPLVRAGGPLEAAIEPRSNGFCTSFAGTGFLQTIPAHDTASRLLFCDDRGTGAQPGTDQSMARGVFVTQTGRARVTRDITSGAGSDIDTWLDVSCP